MPSFRMVMEAVLEAFRNRRDEISARADRTRAQLGAVGRIEAGEDALDPALLEAAAATLAGSADMANGGFGGAPKFPPASALEFLMARGETVIVERTLDAMASGGIYDHVGGGFARYAVDSAWQIPHFEKMLYDNALLARAYLHGWQLLGRERYRSVCEETLDWALREMQGPEGGFYSALDADSEGVEGRFYVWTPEEVREVLGEQADAIIEHFGVSERGNFEGANVLHLPAGAEAEPPPGFEQARAALYEARTGRVRPGLDDKRLTSWNALMISALAEAGAVLGREDYLDAARRCADFLLEGMRDPQGRLLRTYKDGDARINAYLEDHAFLLEALLVLYQATFEPRPYEQAVATAETMIARFGDPERGGFFTTSSDHEQLIARRKEIGDHPIPAGNSAAALGLLWLSELSGEQRYAEQAVGVLRLFSSAAVRHPDAFGHLLQALDFQLSPTRELALCGTRLDDLAAVARERFRPHLVMAGGAEGSEIPELMRGRVEVGGRPAAYLCENFSCRIPVTEPDDLRRQLDGAD
jgi:uncharacterized protein YyaL (SSP411 family)